MDIGVTKNAVFAPFITIAFKSSTSSSTDGETFMGIAAPLTRQRNTRTVSSGIAARVLWVVCRLPVGCDRDQIHNSRNPGTESCMPGTVSLWKFGVAKVWPRRMIPPTTTSHNHSHVHQPTPSTAGAHNRSLPTARCGARHVRLCGGNDLCSGALIHVTSASDSVD